MGDESARTTTRVVLLCDLVGSTRWRLAHGDDHADVMHGGFSRLTDDAVVASGGRVVEDRGDGFLCSFDSATAAVDAAVAIRRRLSETDIGVDAPEIRIGIAAGDVVERGRELYGLPVITAARLEAAAEPGQILCTDTVRQLAGTRAHVRFTDKSSIAAEDLPEPIEAWTVELGDEPADRRGPALVSRASAIPAPVNRFFGRKEVIDEVSGLLADRPLVTITGPGGVGKTRVATEIARGLEGSTVDGCWFVSLESATERDDVVRSIRRALRLPASVGDRSEAALASALATTAGLVVLDNCEQAQEAVATVVDALLSTAPGLRLLATSRQPLGLRSETIWPLEPLAPPAPAVVDTEELLANPAVALFADRARLSDASARPTPADLEMLAELTRRFDGLPLAIELAAGRLNVLSPTEMLARTDDLVPLLERRDHDRPGRHHTMAATVEWSVSTLTAAEKSVLVGLAVFVGGAPLAALEAVCPDVDGELIDIIGRLVDKSLASRVGDRRFAMLIPIREMVLRRADLAHRRHEAEELHLRYYESLARRVGPHLHTQTDWLRRFAEDEGNFGAALDRAEAEGKARAVGLAGDLGLYWVLSGAAADGDRRFSEILAAPGDVEPVILATAMRSAAMAAGLGARYARSEQLLLAARALFAELDRPESIAYCDIWLARNAVVQCHFGIVGSGVLDLALDRLDRAVKTLDASGDAFGVLLAYPYLGWARLLQGDEGAARHLTDDLVERAQAGGPDLFSVYAVAHCGFIRLMLGELDVAATEIETAMVALAESGDTQNLLITSCVGIALHVQRGDLDSARQVAGVVLDCADDCEASEWEALSLAMVSHVVASTGDWQTAARALSWVEPRLPSWRTAIRNTGIDPGLVLEHVAAGAANTEPVPGRPATIRLLRHSLGHTGST